jgi:eukaryotic-like serine/threonine-protein kinase
MIECDDRHLEMLLDADEDPSRSEEIAAHVDSCSHCQTRLAMLVADADEWRNMKKWLSTDDCLTRDEDQERWRNRQRAGNRPAWTESMARQLLAPPSHPEMLGRIGRYEVERLIGAGGMGIVFKAFDGELNRPVAIKVLAPYLAGNGSARKRFGREARAAAAVIDEHVVAIHNVESDGESLFLVMQYVAGDSLHARLDRCGPLDLLEVLRIGMQTARGLAAAHAQGLIHRDVKPSNILLEETVDRALLTDFGLARAADDASLTHSGYHPGTPQYMSPEQTRGEAVDPRSDLFSLGCVMYAMCTGHSPFRAKTTMGVLRRISDDPHRPVRHGQSLSFLNFLKTRRGQTQLLPFLRDGRGDGGWARALKVHYGFNSVEECEAAWLNFIAGQSPSLPGSSGAGDRGES